VQRGLTLERATPEGMSGIRFGSALSLHPVPAHATGEVVGDVLEAVGQQPSLAILFVTHPLTGTFDDIVGAVQQMLCPIHLVAITTPGVLGCGSEVEDGSALALWAVGGGSVETFLLPGADPVADAIGGVPDQQPLPCAKTSSGVLLLADAASFDVTSWLAAQRRGLPIGGASFGSAARQGRGASKTVRSGDRPQDSGAGFNVVYRNGVKVAGGAVAVAFGPEFVFETMVTQSCRPVGDPFTVTKAERNVIYAMGGSSATDALDRTVEQCDDHERTLLRQGIHLGVVVNGGLGLPKDSSSTLTGPNSASLRDPSVGSLPTNSSEVSREMEGFGPGDFVVHHVLGADRNAKAIALSGTCELGDVVQFHVRDAEASRIECQQRLADAIAVLAGEGAGSANVYGALLFPSVSRGTDLFGTEHHDAGTIGEYSSVASAGAFCQSQIGPVGNRSGQHQGALTIALIREATA
jgi:small ligand-binding sensory domain FIST